MVISIIIPTYNRQRDLYECLSSILVQTSTPDEIIIVDNNPNSDLGELIKKRKEEFRNQNIDLKYLINNHENSLTISRNIGIKNAIGEIILFLDDDVVLDKDYLRNILATYNGYADAIGVQGYIVRDTPIKAKQLFNKIFFLFHFEKSKCRVLSSVSATYPYQLAHIISCEWLSGANHSYKKIVFEELKYDERLKKYSDGEDIDFSFSAYKIFQGSLYITPFAKLTHKTSPRGRVLGKELITMREVYGLFLYYKHFDQNVKNKLIYIWSRIGKIIFNTGYAFFRLSKAAVNENFYLIESYIYCFLHRKEIRKGELDFFNRTLH